MTAFEALFRVRHDCPFIRLTEEHPGLRMYSWCNRVHEVYEVIVDDPAEYEKVVKELSGLATVIEEQGDSAEVHIVTSTCFCTPNNSVTMNIEDLDILHVSPVVHDRGWEYYRVVAFRHEDLTKMIRRLEERGFTLEIVRKTEFKGSIAGALLATDAIFSGLTQRQTEALLKAYGYGYYKLPRVADIQEIARRERIPRTTFQEHLKKGENKLIAGLVPYIQLYRGHR